MSSTVKANNISAKDANNDLVLSGNGTGVPDIESGFKVGGVTNTFLTSSNGVTPSSTDTLTNKTFDANGTGNSLSNIDVADLADGTDGQLITWAPDGTANTVATGTATQVLTSNGAGTQPTFEDAAPSGGWEFVSLQTASASTTISFTGFVAGYDYMIAAKSVIPVTDSVQFRSQIGIAGPTYRTTNYTACRTSFFSSGSMNGEIGTSYIPLSPLSGNVADEDSAFTMEIYDPAAATDTYFITVGYAHDQGTTLNNFMTSGFHTTAESIDAIQFYFESGNVSAGEFKLYRRLNA